MKDGLKLRGRVLAVLTGDDGSKQVFESSNIVTDAGDIWAAQKMASAAPTNAFDALHLGTGFGPVKAALTTSAAADDIIDTTAAHGLVAGDKVGFSALTGGAGLNTTTVYYVIAANLGATTFQVSTTPGGAAVNFTTDITAGNVHKPAKTDTANQVTAIAGSGQAVAAGYPRTSDPDADNTGSGADILTWKFTYAKTAGPFSNITEGAIVVGAGALTAGEALFNHFLFASTFSKTTDESLVVYVNIEAAGS